MSAAAAGASPPPVQAYAHPAMAAQLQLSPDGTHIAYFAPINGVHHLVVSKLQKAAGEKPVIIPPGDFQFTGLDWANDKTLIFNVIGRDSVMADGPGRRLPVRFGRMGAVERDGTNLRVLYEPKMEPGYYHWTSGSIVQFIDDEHVMIAAPDRRDQIVGRLNIYTGKLERVDRIRTENMGLLPDPSGQMRLASRFNDRTKTQTTMYRSKLGEEFREINRAALDQGAEFNPLGFGTDGTLYISSNHASDLSAVFKFDIATGTFGEKVLSDARFDTANAVMERGAVIGLQFTRDMPVRIYFDPAKQRLQETLDKAVPVSTEIILDQTRDKRFTLVASFDPMAPTVYRLYDRETKEFTLFADTFPDIPQETIGERKPVTYKARDGLEIHGYLTVPPNREPRKLPFIVLPHGGPIARDDQGFDTLSQFLVSRGYAVLQPNFRGSAGYGRKFVEAGRGEWGGKMQTDVTDGVRWAIENGIADPDRICIVGWSYGGYSALIGAVQDSGLYKCAIATAPVANLDRLWKELSWSSAGTEYNRSIFFDGNRDSLINVSPYHQAARIQIPTLLIHGDMDVQAFIQHSRDMVSALQANGKPHEYIEIKGMDHSPRTTEEMVKILSAWERFLKQHIGN